MLGDLDSPIGPRDLDVPPDATPIWRYMRLRFLVDLLRTSALYCRRLDLMHALEGQLPRADAAARDAGSRLLQPTVVIGETRKLFVVSCWHESHDESGRMWSCFAGGDDGVVVRSTVGQLRAAVRQTRRPVQIGRVRYLDFDVESMGDDDHRRLPWLKPRHLAFEREIRLVAFQQGRPDASIGGGPLAGLGFAEGLRLPIEPEELIAEIRVGPRTHAYTLRRARRAVEAAGLRSELAGASALRDAG